MSENRYKSPIENALCGCQFGVQLGLKNRGYRYLILTQRKGSFVSGSRHLCQLSSKLVKNCDHESTDRQTHSSLCRCFPALSPFREPTTSRASLSTRVSTRTNGRLAFAIAGPTVWNSLPDELKDLMPGSGSYKQFLKTILFSFY